MGEEVARARRHEVSMTVGGADDQQKKGRNEEEDVKGCHDREIGLDAERSEAYNVRATATTGPQLV